jgi:hypothetical protein
MRRYLILCLLAMVAAGLYPAGGASAATGQYCTVEAVPIDPVTLQPLAEQKAPTCFTSAAARDASIDSVAANRTLVDFYVNSNYGGGSVKLIGPSCSGGINLRAMNFDNVTSSLWNDCGRVTLYFDIYTGPQQSYGHGGTSYVGSGMNDEASSAIVEF